MNHFLGDKWLRDQLKGRPKKKKKKEILQDNNIAENRRERLALALTLLLQGNALLAAYRDPEM